MAANLKPGGGLSSQGRGPSPSSRLNFRTTQYYPSLQRPHIPSSDMRALFQHLDAFVRHLNQAPFAIPEEQYRLNLLVQPLKTDPGFCAEICQHLWNCCLHGLTRSTQNNGHYAGGGDGNGTLPELSSYDFARLCTVLVNATTFDAMTAPQQQPYFKALLTLCSDNYEKYVKPFLERHEPTSTSKFDKNALKLVLQVNADLIGQMDSLPLLKSAMLVVIRTCYSIIHVDDRRRDPQALSEELLFAAATSVLRVAGPKIDDPTVVAHLLKDYPNFAHELQLWEETFTQIRSILIASDESKYSGRVKTQLLALLEARAGYWGMLSSQYAAMQMCASAYVAGDPQAYGAACAEYYKTFGSGLATSTATTGAEVTAENEQVLSSFVPQSQQNYTENYEQGIVQTDSNYYADGSSNHSRPTSLHATGVSTGEQRHGGEVNDGGDDYERYLQLNGLPPEDVDDDAEAEFEKFQSGEGAYTGGEDDGVTYGNITHSMGNLGLGNGAGEGYRATSREKRNG